MIVVKIGGGAGLDLPAVVQDLAGLRRPFVLLHGANQLRDELAAALGRPTKVVESVSGYSSTLTDDDAMDVFLAAYAPPSGSRGSTAASCWARAIPGSASCGMGASSCCATTRASRAR